MQVVQSLLGGGVERIGSIGFAAKLPVRSSMNEYRRLRTSGCPVKQGHAQEQGAIKHAHHLVEAGRLCMDRCEMVDRFRLELLYKSIHGGEIASDCMNPLRRQKLLQSLRILIHDRMDLHTIGEEELDKR
jgi:hypothetical protein